MMMLTSKQLDLMEAYHKFREKHGRRPSQKELAEALGIKQPTVQNMLKRIMNDDKLTEFDKEKRANVFGD